tara:strand:- start:417 stop:557 length:141 start_codon:yes stop_codon:yes gene_type:complete
MALRKVRKPKAPKLHAGEQSWTNYRRKLAEYKKYQAELDKRRKLKY